MSAVGGWQVAAALPEISQGLHELILGNEVVLLVRRGDEILAMQGLCPHTFARLADGQIDAEGWLHCPRHKARFRLADGACGSGWVLPPLRQYEVRVADGMVLLPDPLTPRN